MSDVAGADDHSPVALPAREFDLVIFDLDGVLTRTARVHTAAWKRVFDACLSRHLDGDLAPFEPTADYLGYVDGKPRLDGARDFLASRGLELPEGAPGDRPGQDTLWGLGNEKNRIFNALLESRGVETYASGVALLERLAKCGIRTAVVSASRNCRRVLAAAGLSQQVDTVIDGNDAAHDGLAGKPAPDTFLAAARRLGIPPSRAAVIEDAEAGVAAARAGAFALVIGVDRADHGDALRHHGAHRVVRRLDQLHPQGLPSPLDALAQVRGRLGHRRPAVFLDYDGTLTPIVDRPQDAVLGSAMAEALSAVARSCTVAVVSGRGLDDIRDRVAMDALVYVADHGFQIQCPGEAPVQPEVIVGFEPLVEQTTGQLRARLGAVTGVLIEAKRYSVAVHYRLVQEAAVDGVRSVVAEIAAGEPRLRLLSGKKVLELQPDVAWDKGAAVGWLMRRLALVPDQMVYVGDDVTDESVFHALRDAGTTVVVQDVPRPSAALFRLDSVESVRLLLEKLAALGAGS